MAIFGDCREVRVYGPATFCESGLLCSDEGRSGSMMEAGGLLISGSFPPSEVLQGSDLLTGPRCGERALHSSLVKDRHPFPTLPTMDRAILGCDKYMKGKRETMAVLLSQRGTRKGFFAAETVVALVTDLLGMTSATSTPILLSNPCKNPRKK